MSKYRPVIFRTTKDWIRIVFKWFVEQLEHCQERRDEKFFPTFSTDSWSGKNVNKGVRREREREGGRERERRRRRDSSKEKPQQTNNSTRNKQRKHTHTRQKKSIYHTHSKKYIDRKLIIKKKSNIQDMKVYYK